MTYLRKILLGFGVVLLAVAVLLWFFPARWAVALIAPQLHGMQLQQVTGSVWQGNAGQWRDREGHDRHDQVVRGNHPRDPLDRRVECAVQVGEREHDDRRVREGDRDRDGEREERQRPSHGLTLIGPPVGGSAGGRSRTPADGGSISRLR